MGSRNFSEMKAGEKKKINNSIYLSYGDSGYSPIIPPKANLIFEVELLAINQ